MTDAPKLALVVAMARGNVIGSGGSLPWRISDDLKWFKKSTLGKPIIMGRKTYESIGRPLPGRANIVITRNKAFLREGVTVEATIEAAVNAAKMVAAATGAEEFCIIGGGEIYRQTMALADRIYLTEVDAEINGDVFFPKIDKDDWRRRRQGGCAAGERNDFGCDFFVLDRIGDSD